VSDARETFNELAGELDYPMLAVHLAPREEPELVELFGKPDRERRRQVRALRVDRGPSRAADPRGLPELEPGHEA
jgi:hypothetical protein